MGREDMDSTLKKLVKVLKPIEGQWERITHCSIAYVKADLTRRREDIILLLLLCSVIEFGFGYLVMKVFSVDKSDGEVI